MLVILWKWNGADSNAACLPFCSSIVLYSGINDLVLVNNFHYLNLMKTTKTFFVYMLSNYSNKLLYIGVTSDLAQRVHQHKTGFYDGFTKKYNINRLLYFEVYPNAETAISREKQMKSYSRSKKNKLIDEVNPQWREIKPPINNL